MDTNLNRAVGVELRAMRLEAGLTQSTVATALGKPQSYVSKLESGERSLRLDEAHDYVAALNMQIGTFMWRVQVCINDYRKLQCKSM